MFFGFFCFYFLFIDNFLKEFSKKYFKPSAQGSFNNNYFNPLLNEPSFCVNSKYEVNTFNSFVYLITAHNSASYKAFLYKLIRFIERKNNDYYTLFLKVSEIRIPTTKWGKWCWDSSNGSHVLVIYNVRYRSSRKYTLQLPYKPFFSNANFHLLIVISFVLSVLFPYK